MILTSSNNYDILLDSNREADFLLSNNRRRLGLRDFCFSIANRNAPFYLENKMPKGIKGFQKGHKSGMTGKHHSIETLLKMSKVWFKKGQYAGEKHWNWKGGVSKDINKRLREYRHRKGISKKFISKYGGKVFTKKEHRQRRKALVRGGGEFFIEYIQMVYEDNIKKYGTLTCIYCLNQIIFGQDSLEHKTPLSRGGNNEYENLAIACQKCNSSKHNKTEEEYRKEIFKK